MTVLTPIKAIRAKCMDCTCHQPKEIRLCRIITCPLWPYRMGHRPKGQEAGQLLEEAVAPVEPIQEAMEVEG